jgi:peptidoglycan/xylan/chitin deacetylase (PgdA/CDA1 family)
MLRESKDVRGGDPSEGGSESWTPGADLLILCYHAVSRRWSSPLAVHPNRLEAQIRFLLRRGYAAKTLSDAVGNPARRMFVVTFDDAYRSVTTEALPVLERLGVPASLFVPTDLVDNRGLMTELIQIPDAWAGDDDDMRGMSWDEVRRLVGAGWEVGSHTCSHPDLTRLGTGETRAELQRSRSVCENELQLTCDSLAYPFGFHDEPTMQIARQAGYRRAVTLELHLLTPLYGRGLMDLPREGIYPTTNWPKFLINTSRLIRRARFSTLFGAMAKAPQ